MSSLESLDELLRMSDVISLHLPLLDSTRNLIGTDAFRKMTPHDASLTDDAFRHMTEAVTEGIRTHITGQGTIHIVN